MSVSIFHFLVGPPAVSPVGSGLGVMVGFGHDGRPQAVALERGVRLSLIGKGTP